MWGSELANYTTEMHTPTTIFHIFLRLITFFSRLRHALLHPKNKFAGNINKQKLLSGDIISLGLIGIKRISVKQNTYQYQVIT